MMIVVAIFLQSLFAEANGRGGPDWFLVGGDIIHPEYGDKCFNPDMVVSECAGHCQPTCERGEHYPCTKDCRRGCVCRPGLWLWHTGNIYFGLCVSPKACDVLNALNAKPKCDDVDKVYSECACQATCERRKGVTCPKVCKSGCVCRHGLWLSEETGKCVRPADCRKYTCADQGKVFSECGASHICQPTCEREAPPVCQAACQPGCVCPSGLRLHISGICVTPAFCQAERQCWRRDMVYSPCFLACQPTCRDGRSYWDFDECFSRCEGGCVCPGRLLDEATGKCVDSCPPLAPPLPPVTVCSNVEQVSPTLKEMVKSDSSSFAWKFYRSVLSQNGVYASVFFSPYSLFVALNMLLPGARGKTRRELKHDILLPSFSSQLFEIEHHSAIEWLLSQINDGNSLSGTLSSANAAFVRKNFQILANYSERIEKCFHAEIIPTDFSQQAKARNAINNWVADKTNSLIQDLIPDGEPDGDAVLLLVNAIYFKGLWLYPFNTTLPSGTASHLALFMSTNSVDIGPFYPLSKKRYITLPTMTVFNKFNYYYDDYCQMVQIPYSIDGLMMYIFLPHEKPGLFALENEIETSMPKLISMMNPLTMRITMPKFEMSESISAVEMLKSMGLKDVFYPGVADLSGIDGSRFLSVSNINHKAKIEVNELGTEAAAATSIEIILRSGPMHLVINRPFIFVIRHETTGQLLFIGRFVG